VSIGMFLFSYSLAPDTPPQWLWGAIVLQLLMLAVIGGPVVVLFDAITNFYRRTSASGRLPGTRSVNRFK
ncbi:MAG: hypothetical protein OEL68_04425, partial [Desulfobulbaceae bacterium]|nr:hypothetical protein [Desulfobulbaceae bacterium]